MVLSISLGKSLIFDHLRQQIFQKNDLQLLTYQAHQFTTNTPVCSSGVGIGDGLCGLNDDVFHVDTQLIRDHLSHL